MNKRKFGIRIQIRIKHINQNLLLPVLVVYQIQTYQIYITNPLQILKGQRYTQVAGQKKIQIFLVKKFVSLGLDQAVYKRCRKLQMEN